MASPAAALSLGAIHVQSHLGEPLRAEIDITQITAAEAGSLQATLASPDVFQAHGMELSPTARNVRVELISPAKGGSKIRLTTTSPVNDPFIDLILQANWSAGNLTRGYTLLLDPPPVQKPPAPTTAVQASTPAQTGQTYRSQPRTAAPSASSTAAATGTTDATSSVTVRTGDTAGRIAAAHAITGISLDQMLVAMLRNNPSAFINGNINRIKAGAVVSIPNAEQAQSTSAKEARRIIATQSKDFNAYRRKLAERTTQAQVGEAERSASGKVQAQVEDATAATTPTDKLTLSKGAAASKVEDKLMAEKQSTAQNDRTKELERNLAELEKLSDASAATTAAGSVAASAETAMPPTPGDNATAGDAPASPLTVEANAPVLPLQTQRRPARPLRPQTPRQSPPPLRAKQRKKPPSPHLCLSLHWSISCSKTPCSRPVAWPYWACWGCWHGANASNKQPRPAHSMTQA
ncbi:MAG TPA: FimV/HubP family polar landmark protein [Comamonas denitrificans]|nr:FimV/HubP family polar landmark protein [Comamonas denitrificans]